MNRNSIKKYIIAFVGTSAAFITLFAFLSGIHDLSSLSIDSEVQTSGSYGEWLRDKYMEVKIPDEVRGVRLGSDPYEIDVEVKNRTSQILYVSRITISRYNEQLVDNNEPIFVGEHISAFHLGPGETDKIISHGNRLIPKRLLISIHHNLADKPSTFDIDVGGHEIPLRTPKIIDENTLLQLGLDGKIAIDLAAEKLKETVKKFYLFTAVPANSRIMFDEKSLYRLTQVQSWYVTFASENNRLYSFVVSEDSLEDNEASDSSIPLRPVPLPLIGNIEALSLASKSNKIAGDWQDLKLIGGRRGNKWTCAWLLPYLDSDENPIIIDAIYGDFVSMKIVREGPTMLHDVPIYLPLE